MRSRSSRPAVRVVADLADPALRAAADRFVAFLAACGWGVAAPRPVAVVVLSDVPRTPPGADVAELASRVPVLLAGPTVASWLPGPGLPDEAGLLVESELPEHEIRLGLRADPDVLPLPDPTAVRDRLLVVGKAADDVEVLVDAPVGLRRSPVLTFRPTGPGGVGVLTVGRRPELLGDPEFGRLVHGWLRHVLAMPPAPPVRVGMLGFGAIGAEHAAAVQAVRGLELAAVCDTNPSRVASARAIAPQAREVGDAAALCAADDVDLVIVSTPPNRHAAEALRALHAGKHVVVEKPFTLTVADADAVLAAADECGRRVFVYQNRRFDRDFRAVRAVVESGRIGDVFHYESFVGSHAHPCNFWHSDAAVSGGALYDWGAHYVDWLLQLLPPHAHGGVEWVSATTHKRVWHDVTNADHSRMLVHFVDGVEGEFTHSDLAAAPKPRFYLLGTDGAVVGRARDGDTPADVVVSSPDGSRTAVALPPEAPTAFHRELADALRCGIPPTVLPEQSRAVVALLAAANQSAEAGGRPVAPVP